MLSGFLQRAISAVRLWARAAYWFWKTSRTGITPLPRTVSIDPLSACNLKCPLCPTGAGLVGKGRQMSLECFQKLVDKMPFVRKLVLFKWGEPFLHRQILSMIRYATDRQIETVISTNFSFPRDDEFFTGVIESGLTTCIASIDGASQETYEKYRVGGDFEQAFGNMKRLADRKREMGSSTPEVVWQFLVNRHNEHEIPLARELAEQLGVTLYVGPIGLGDDLPDVRFPKNIEERKELWLPRNPEYVSSSYKGEYKRPLLQQACRQIFKTAVINPEGQLLPCCFANNPRSALGEPLKQSFEEIWTSNAYRQSRLFQLGRPTEGKNHSVCWSCHRYTRSPSWKEKLGLFLSIARTEEEEARRRRN